MLSIYYDLSNIYIFKWCDINDREDKKQALQWKKSGLKKEFYKIMTSRLKKQESEMEQKEIFAVTYVWKWNYMQAS